MKVIIFDDDLDLARRMQALDDEQAGLLCRAACHYIVDGYDTDFLEDSLLDGLWKSLRKSIVRECAEDAIADDADDDPVVDIDAAASVLSDACALILLALRQGSDNRLTKALRILTDVMPMLSAETVDFEEIYCLLEIADEPLRLQALQDQRWSNNADLKKAVDLIWTAMDIISVGLDNEPDDAEDEETEDAGDDGRPDPYAAALDRVKQAERVLFAASGLRSVHTDLKRSAKKTALSALFDAVIEVLVDD